MTMTFLDYSTTDKEIDRLPILGETKQSSGKGRAASFWAVVALSVASSFIYGWMLNSEVGFLLTGLALVPLTALVVISLWLAPRSEAGLLLRLFAVIWGGVGATNLTLIIANEISKIFGVPSLHITVVVQAAILEEFCKALFLFGVFFWFKHLVRTPLAGAALGILVGAGFAFIENIMYFNNAFLQGSWTALWSTVILRAGMSFFLHALATMFTGMFIGYVVSKRAELTFWKKLMFLEMGLLAAMTVHGMWNGMASLSTDNMKWNILYLLFWIPFTSLMVVTMIFVRKNYLVGKTNTVIAAARRGYIKMSQAERITTKKTRKALYKGSNTSDIISWESSLLRVQFWNESLSATQKSRRITKLNKKKSKDMMKLAKVVSKV